MRTSTSLKGLTAFLTDDDLRLSSFQNDWPKTITWANAIPKDIIAGTAKDENEWNEVRGPWNEDWFIENMGNRTLESRIDIEELE